ncbi:phosphotransferase family protein [Paenibacillus sp. UNC451MF]|uniref:phosphotransferase family protein n=1 Tax=Paenibacillus sp. UNC451MF TaxID=1449063 RepID=UPI00048A4A64|nr:aminoglycoside phosphotransferase family protein [Paenibacillus sp. UNC451MF]
MHLFQKDIYDWKSWGTVYQSLEDFQPLIEAIFKKEKLTGYEDTSRLTPGTNAVFKAGNYVIKIFAPKESGANPDDDYNAELRSMQRAIQSGIRAPQLIASSRIQDKYEFKYLIMEHIEGQAAGAVLKEATWEQKQKFIRKLKRHLQKMNLKPVEKADEALIKERAIQNPRWNRFPDKVRLQVAELINQYEWADYVYVHGDLTADNIIIDSHGEMYIIDFADSTIAPAEYEYPPILFDLFNYDKELIHEFIQGMDYTDFIDKAFMVMLIHDFGGDFVKTTYEKLSGLPIVQLTDIFEVKELMYRQLKI